MMSKFYRDNEVSFFKNSYDDLDRWRAEDLDDYFGNGDYCPELLEHYEARSPIADDCLPCFIL